MTSEFISSLVPILIGSFFSGTAFLSLLYGLILKHPKCAIIFYLFVLSFELLATYLLVNNLLAKVEFFDWAFSL